MTPGQPPVTHPSLFSKFDGCLKSWQSLDMGNHALRLGLPLEQACFRLGSVGKPWSRPGMPPHWCHTCALVQRAAPRHNVKWLSQEEHTGHQEIWAKGLCHIAWGITSLTLRYKMYIKHDDTLHMIAAPDWDEGSYPAFQPLPVHANLHFSQKLSPFHHRHRFCQNHVAL